MKNFLSALLYFSLCAPAAYATHAPNPDANAVDSACASDAATAGCGGETVGHGMLKCMHAFKKTHSDFKVSPGCKTALHQMNEDKKSARAAHPQSPQASDSVPAANVPNQPFSAR